HEGFHGGLPIRLQHERLVPGVAHRFELQTIEELRYGIDEVRERFTIRIHVDEYPTAPDSHLHLRQVDVAAGHVSAAVPITAVRDARVLALQIPLPAVEGALDRK